MTKAQVIALIDQYITTNGNEEITGAQTNSVMKALANQDLPFGEILSTPTTLSGYGITDAYTKSASDNRYVNVSGDTMTGALTVGGDITIPNTSWLKDTGGNNLIRATSGGFVNVGGDNVTNPTAITLYANSEVRLKNLVPLKDDAGYEWMNMTSGGFLRIGYQNPGAITLFGGSSPRYNNGTSNYDLWHQGNLRSNSQNDSRYALQSTQIITGNHLSGGGNLSTNRTLTVTPTVSQWIVDSQGNQRMYFNSASNGGVVLKSSAAGGQLRYWDMNDNQVFRVDDSGNVTASGNITATAFYESSDIRLKKNIEPLNYGLNEIEKIDTHTWNWKNNNESDIGMIAQELEEIIPELVKTNEEGYKSVNYTKLVPILINSIKELSNQVKALKNG